MPLILHSSPTKRGASPTGAEADWLSRSTGTGVVWAHDFRNEDEFNCFRASEVLRSVNAQDGTVVGGPYGAPDYAGTGSTTATLQGTAFAGASSRFFRCSVPDANAAAGFAAGTWYTNNLGNQEIFAHHPDDTTTTLVNDYARYLGMMSSGGWNRPFFPLEAGGNGKATADPAANGTIRRVTWNKNNPTETYDWAGTWWGHFCHADYADDKTRHFEDIPNRIGGEFWLQFRIRFSAGRFTTVRTAPAYNLSDWTFTDPADSVRKECTVAGKGAMVWTMYGSLTNEIVFYSGYGGGSAEWFWPNTLPLRWYTAGGTQGSIDNKYQYGSAWDATCIVTNNPFELEANDCWYWPEDEWVTVLLHVVPGHDAVADTLVDIKVARYGETSWTQVWYGNFAFDTDTDVKGWSKVSLNAYMNALPSWGAFHHDYTQVILSTQAIACPQAY